MSSANILLYVSVGAFVLAGVCAVLAIVLFFRLDIRGVIGDLTGKTVAKEVQSMRAETKQSEESHERMRIPHGMTTSTNLSNSKIIDKRRKAKEQNKATDLGSVPTAYVSQDDNATTLLSQEAGATTLLSQEDSATTLLQQDMDATTLLGQGNGEETTLLGQSNGEETTLLGEQNTGRNVSFTICSSVIVVHTDEVIA